MELVVLSGKGGTGKTTIANGLAKLAEDALRIDCDVDAPNLYLFDQGMDIRSEAFFGSKEAVKDEQLCVQCGRCDEVCRFQAIKQGKINGFLCEGCGACVISCPQKAIQLVEQKTADTYISQLERGLISRAEMEIGSDGSGKLISQLRKRGKAYLQPGQLIISDGSPGIGCPVISSVTGSDGVLIVTEPTKSGLADLKRVVELCRHFKVFVMVCINKYDINLEMTKSIEDFVEQQELVMIGKIPYDEWVRQSINELRPITDYQESKAAQEINKMWDIIQDIFINQ